MIRSRKSWLVISIILAYITTLSRGAEPNEAKIDLKFKTENKKSQLWLGGHRDTRGQGPIKPSHVAVLHIQRPHIDMPSSHEGILEILGTPTGKSLSEQQRKFLTASDAVTWWGIEDIQNHDTVLLYAVSEEDAKKTVQAYLEVAIDKANTLKLNWKNLLRKAEEKVAKIKKELPGKEAQAEAAKVNYQRMKNQFHELFADEDAVEEAKETIHEMNRTLNTLNIEIKGIEAKLSAIKEYKSKKNVSIEGLAKLEQILSEQTIELAGALAKKEAAIQIRTVEEEFYKLYTEWSTLESEVQGLNDDLRSAETNVYRAKQTLTNPVPEMLPPVVYQDTVTIYPVLTK